MEKITQKAKNNNLAIYAGSFDPITYGHIDIIRRALKLFDRLIIAVGENPNKKPLFSMQERTSMIQEATIGLNVSVESFSGLLVEFARKHGCNKLIRSLRAVSDFDFEFQMAIMNRELDGSIETVFLMTDKEFFYLSSGLAKDVARKQGKLEKLVPPNVEKKLKAKFNFRNK
ncbi:MAG: pantetheine-phosphate adenylyltransferase [archaeon GW2011_AR3]|nr:MAG: pantetheine-phosphate adenylyltransferase [archaeon GW2011_AR3]MBS3109490.1 pantetheine-phosphate adenylyltransferase [Candidatus Woesearchaeota archaeon]